MAKRELDSDLPRWRKRGRSTQTPDEVDGRSVKGDGAAAAGAAPPAEAAEEGGVCFGREISAWDALGDRFAAAAQKGNVVDLSLNSDDAAGGREQLVSASDAAMQFRSLPRPKDPRCVVPAVPQGLVGGIEVGGGHKQNPRLLHVHEAVAALVIKLSEVRVVLLSSLKENAVVQPEELERIVEATKVLQAHVDVSRREVSKDRCLMAKLNILNNLVHKADVLIFRYNKSRGLI